MITEIILIALAYLIGSLSTAIIVCKTMGLPDPRKQGSGNPGATNVLRIGGKKAAAITLLGDMLKGFIPVLAAHTFTPSPTTIAIVAMAAFLGHLYPIFFRFRGGKGVATAFGVLLGLSWPVALAVLATWLLTVFLSKTSSLSAMTTAALTPLYTWWLEGSGAYFVLSMVLPILLIWRHRENIQKLIHGKEEKIRN